MTVGPIQVIIFGFERADQFRGEVLEELANLRGRGLIRLIDLYVAFKEASGELIEVNLNDLTEEESVEFGQVIRGLLGNPDLLTGEAATGAIEGTLAAASQSIGLEIKTLQQLVDRLEPGRAVGVMMFEHTWAIPLRDAIRRAGGMPLAQGFITQEALLMIGEELRTIVEAERAIEVAEIVRSAAILDKLATLEEASALKTSVAADIVRTLAVAGLIEETAVAEAIETLAAANLLDTEYLEAAKKAETQEAAEDQEVFATED